MWIDGCLIQNHFAPVWQHEEKRQCEGRNLTVGSGAEWTSDKDRISTQTGEHTALFSLLKKCWVLYVPYINCHAPKRSSKLGHSRNNLQSSFLKRCVISIDVIVDIFFCLLLFCFTLICIWGSSKYWTESHGSRMGPWGTPQVIIYLGS